MITIHLIWAQEQNGGIGINNDLPWHISKDLKNFKKLTLNKPIIMGRKTWESLPFKPLPKRRNIVLSSREMENIESYTSVDECIKNVNDETDIFVIGGAQIYEAFFPLAHQLHITMVDKKTSGIDTFFPISMDDIKLNFSMSKKNRLTDMAIYTHWKKS